MQINFAGTFRNVRCQTASEDANPDDRTILGLDELSAELTRISDRYPDATVVLYREALQEHPQQEHPKQSRSNLPASDRFITISTMSPNTGEAERLDERIQQFLDERQCQVCSYSPETDYEALDRACESDQVRVIARNFQVVNPFHQAPRDPLQ